MFKVGYYKGICPSCNEERATIRLTEETDHLKMHCACGEERKLSYVSESTTPHITQIKPLP